MFQEGEIEISTERDGVLVGYGEGGMNAENERECECGAGTLKP